MNQRCERSCEKALNIIKLQIEEVKTQASLSNRIERHGMQLMTKISLLKRLSGRRQTLLSMRVQLLLRGQQIVSVRHDHKDTCPG